MLGQVTAEPITGRHTHRTTNLRAKQPNQLNERTEAKDNIPRGSHHGHQEEAAVALATFAKVASTAQTSVWTLHITPQG